MNNSTILIFSHTDYTTSVGGIEKVIMEHSTLFKEEGFDVLHISPVSETVKVCGHTFIAKRIGYRVIKNGGYENEKADYQTVEKIIKQSRITYVFIHSLIGFSFSHVCQILDIVHPIKTYFYIHDYKLVCTGHVLLRNKLKYCGSDGRSFPKCVFCRFYLTGINDNKHYRHFIESRKDVIYIFPSEIACKIWHNVYSQVEVARLEVLPHQVMKNLVKHDSYQHKKLRIAYIGYKSFNKGWSAFKTIYNHDKNSDYDYYVLGRTDEHLPNVKEVEVSFIEDGPDAMIKAIRKNEIDVALLWSPWPETYSYTFYESYVGGAFILTNENSGNIQAKTLELDCGKVLKGVNELLRYVSSDELQKDVKKNTKKRYGMLELNSSGLKKMIDNAQV